MKTIRIIKVILGAIVISISIANIILKEYFLNMFFDSKLMEEDIYFVSN